MAAVKIKKPVGNRTPRTKIRAGLRRIWQGSREKNAALKKAGYRCEMCSVKKSQAKGKEQKIQVHHIKKIDWEELIDLVYERLLQTPEDYMCLCPDCHKKIHEKEPNKT